LKAIRGQSIKIEENITEGLFHYSGEREADTNRSVSEEREKRLETIIAKGWSSSTAGLLNELREIELVLGRRLVAKEQ